MENNTIINTSILWRIIAVLSVIFLFINLGLKEYKIIGTLIFRENYIDIESTSEKIVIPISDLKKIVLVYKGFEGNYSLTRLVLKGSHLTGSKNVIILTTSEMNYKHNILFNDPIQYKTIVGLLQEISMANKIDFLHQKENENYFLI